MSRISNAIPGADGHFVCPAPDSAYSQTDVFYALNPMIQPIPQYVHLVGFELNDEHPYNIKDVKVLYDPFNIDEPKNMIVVLTWVEPVPYTTPLYLFRGSQGVYVSWDKEIPKGFTLMGLAPIYVLTKERKKTTVSATGKNDYFPPGIPPHFTFTLKDGRCLPDPKGEELTECILDTETNFIRPPSLLEKLGDVQKREEDKRVVITYTMSVILLFLLVGVLSRRRV